MVADLVRQAQGGDPEAYAELVRHFQDAVYATAYQKVMDVDTARDLAQEAFVRAYQALHKLRRPEAFPAWVVSVCRNLTNDWLRRPERRWVPLDETTRDEADLSSAVAARDLVNRALATLPEDNRLALSLFLVNGYTYQEVAALTGTPLTTIKGRIERARGKLATEVLSMVETDLKSNAPDEQFTLETVKESLERGWEAATAQDLATSRIIAEEALVRLQAEATPEGTELRANALELVARSTFFADFTRWRQAQRDLISLAEAKGDDAALAAHLYSLTLQDCAMPEEEREQAYERCFDLFRKLGNTAMLAQVLFFRGWHHIGNGAAKRGFVMLQEAREALRSQTYGAWRACLDASAEFEQLSDGQFDVARRVMWGAGCNVLKLEGDRITHVGQPGVSWHSGVQHEMAKFLSPWILWQTGWFPHTGPAPGYEEAKSAFSYTPNPTHQRTWIETDVAQVSTPAGQFSDCLLMRVTQSESPLDAHSDHSQRLSNKIWCGEKWCWFARGVGPVAYRAERADGIIAHTVLSKFYCPEQREEWVPLVVGTRWEYVPAEPGEDFDALMVEWLSHCGEDGTWYQPHTAIGNRRGS